jgi:hypothetical protein
LDDNLLGPSFLNFGVNLETGALSFLARLLQGCPSGGLFSLVDRLLSLGR